jgi:hypothetical protein
MEKYSIEEAAKKEFEALLAPKTRGSNRPEPIEKDGQKYYYCRYSGRYWPASEMIYQNDEKRELGQDKGYSKVGISLWTRGRKYLDKIKSALTDEILSEKPDKNKIEEYKKILSGADYNDKDWLMENILSDDDDLSPSIEK